MHKYKYVQNKECPFFPCHEMDKEKFNCLFCYCPLYTLGDKCGGDFYYLENGIKSCDKCTKTHHIDTAFDHVMSHINEVLELAKKE